MYIEKDAALERRFQKVQVDEPDQDDTIAILRGQIAKTLLDEMLIAHKKHLPQFADKIAELEAQQ